MGAALLAMSDTGATGEPEAAPPAGDGHLFAPFDREMQAYMEARRIPGGALAVVRGDRLVYARGYGWADREQKVPAAPQSLFRLASISKPITALAVMRLVEEGRLSLEDRAFDRVPLEPLPGQRRDPRIGAVTVRHLLQNTGGWDRNATFDPMFRDREIARAAGVPPPPGPQAIIRYMLGRPLDFDPGTRYAYSNFGYCVLGRVVEQASGQPYAQYVREKVLAPLGITRMRVGASLPEGRAPGEVRYYMAGRGLDDSVFPGAPRRVPAPYGSFHLEAMDAHGGWIASAVDLARIAAALHRPERCPILKPGSLAEMVARPAPPPWRDEEGRPTAHYYACGWLVRPTPQRGPGAANYWHNGSLPGTYTLLVRRWDGLSWAVLFNLRNGSSGHPDEEIDPALHRAADAVREWPDRDLFPLYR